MGNKTGQELYNERLERITKAMNLEKPDRTPIGLDGPGFIKYADPSAKLADYIRRPKWANDMVLKAHAMLEEIDVAPMGGLNYTSMGAMWLSRTKLPGRELPEDALWQIDEVGAMTEEDYDTIINKGWNAFSGDFLINRLGYKPEELAPDMEALGESARKTTELGLVNVIGAVLLPPFELLSGARSVSKFYRDLHRIPDKVIAAMDVMQQEIIEGLRTQIRSTKPMAVFIGATRSAGEFISLKKFEKFAWPYTRSISYAIIEEGSKPWFHHDSCWDANIPYFAEFPKASCVFDPDGMTNIFKMKELLGDKMCITGDVQPALLAIGTPDEVYRYARKINDEIGPEGFIMWSGCSVPPNTPLENIKAVIAAATGK
ncbi:MAG: uroporphyrinogen decarboxylase family protein [Clostridiales bacterium]|jgi:uroporphyrinogen decarboxylase|nr:uroporphyrinogen-III decarboxylase [Eubacteriales bacterium]MDH7566282.1 uroporphyrinogen decarboxylase family protein [Clostridiales bacterium]